MTQAGSDFLIHRVPLRAGDDPADERPHGVVVVPAFQGDAAAALARYEAAAAAASPARFPRAVRLAALSLGPPQDEEDECAVTELLSARWEFELQVTRTSARLASGRPSRAHPWRALAMALLPAELRPGDYSLHALWITRGQPGKGRRELMPEYLTQAFEFEVTG